MEDIHVCIHLENLNVTTINFYKSFLKEYNNPNSSLSSFLLVPNGIEIFKPIEIQFHALQDSNILVGILDIISLTIQQSTHETRLLMLQAIKDLLFGKKGNKDDHLITLRLVKQFLITLPYDFPIDRELEEEIVSSIDYTHVRNEVAFCMSLLIEKYHKTYLLEIVWNMIMKKKSSTLFMSYIDVLIQIHHIYRSFQCWELLEGFLKASHSRKAAIFTIRKIISYLSTTEEVVCVENYFNWPDFSWAAYLTILDNLEEKQAHLILPSLQMLENVNLGENTPWLKVLYQQMLSHKNNVVLRWSVNYMLKNFADLIIKNDLLKQFFCATNNTWLFGEKEAFRFPYFGTEEQDNFMVTFSEIVWKSIPMHAWLMEMKRRVAYSCVKGQTLINVAARIRQLQNRFIRSSCRDLFVSMFYKILRKMDLEVYMNFLDAFYSSTDRLRPQHLKILLSKIDESSKPFLSFNVFTILRKQQFTKLQQNDLMEKLLTVKFSDQKWFSILVVFFFESSKIKNDVCLQLYEINLKDAIWNQSLEEITGEFVKSLSWDDMSEAVIRELTVDWYATQCKPIEPSEFYHLLSTGGIKTLLKLSDPEQRNFQLDEEMLDALVKELKNLAKQMVFTRQLIENIIESTIQDQPSLLYTYINEILDIDVTNNRLAFNVFSKALPLCDYDEVEGRKLIIRGLLFGEPFAGDARLEYDYAVRVYSPDLERLDDESSHKVRRMCLQFLKNLTIETMELIKTDLINLSKTMSIRKPRYYENTKHHRRKLRIAEALNLLNYHNTTWQEYYLYAILQENNQTNITYIYEFLVATTISESDLFDLIETIAQLSGSCQSYVIAIAYLYTVHHDCDMELIHKFINIIVPWTMGSNFTTRLYAQMTINEWINRYDLENLDFLQNVIEKGLDESQSAIEKLNVEIIFKSPREHFYSDFVERVLYVTAVPEDECFSSTLSYLDEYDYLKKSRMQQMLKRDQSKEEPEMNMSFEFVQRKMNPEINANTHDLMSLRSELENKDMIVVASLIDKLPNLGGIARTCEVLGIKNLVLSSVKQAQSVEFKNLSMTAENWINISEVKPNGIKEFLLNKQTEGYEIVGAEQTSNSVNFMEFRFPEKCVLLLGHEKEGIPADLIALLNHAVEIPQFGMVRSLNVHVTGALFMYEYCKQHLSELKM